ncbi:hypothetical protein BDR05DRAFT_969117 [Suillus weaverae]|nr:hypothetical protein BDR05DRAFT_969117 [Suillus weaverae]
MQKTEGEVALFGNVAYAVQNPWCVAYVALSSMVAHLHLCPRSASREPDTVQSV